MATLLLNVGNTHACLAAADFSWMLQLSTQELLRNGHACLRDPQVRSLHVATVVPELRAALAAAHPSLDLRFVEAERVRARLDLSAVDARTVGADRLANAAAAALSLPQRPVLVVDAGTCITTELVVPPERPGERSRFLGGAILPGRLLMRRALQQGTAQLPQADLSALLPPAWGTDTLGAIRCGVDHACLGGVQRLAVAATAAWPDLEILLTGGDAPFFAAAFPWRQAEPHFTLQGIAYLCRD